MGGWECTRIQSDSRIKRSVAIIDDVIIVFMSTTNSLSLMTQCNRLAMISPVSHGGIIMSFFCAQMPL